ncbi:hypothetical protein Tco_0766078 [Tanacetum coccineum]
MGLITTLSDRIGVLEADLSQTKKIYSSAYTKLILRVKKHEISDKGWEGQEDIPGLFFQILKLVQMILPNRGGSSLMKRGSGKVVMEISTAGKKKDTASEEVPPVSTAEVQVSTAGGTATYSRRSAEKRKDKGKGLNTKKEALHRDIESLSTKFPIVDWKTIVLTETHMYYQVFRGDGSSKNYKILSEMLEDFDRMDVEQLFRKEVSPESRDAVKDVE